MVALSAGSRMIRSVRPTAIAALAMRRTPGGRGGSAWMLGASSISDSVREGRSPVACIHGRCRPLPPASRHAASADEEREEHDIHRAKAPHRRRQERATWKGRPPAPRTISEKEEHTGTVNDQADKVVQQK